jgi:hypothetical protein
LNIAPDPIPRPKLHVELAIYRAMYVVIPKVYIDGGWRARNSSRDLHLTSHVLERLLLLTFTCTEMDAHEHGSEVAT